MDAPNPASIALRRRIEWMDTGRRRHLPLDDRVPARGGAEAALHTALGFADITFGATPRVRVQADFKRSLRFNDAVDVTLAVAAVGRTSVRYRLAIAHDGAPVAEGEITSCFIDRETGRAIPWPDHVREGLVAGGEQQPPAV
jgi:acyl-CoA thioesterase FadM